MKTTQERFINLGGRFEVGIHHTHLIYNNYKMKIPNEYFLSTDVAHQEVLNYYLDMMPKIDGAAQEKLDELAQQQVMTTFLAEMKVVFDKYSATISTMAFEDGYGVGYGEPGTGFLLTAHLDNVTSTKEIKKAVISSGDLV